MIFRQPPRQQSSDGQRIHRRPWHRRDAEDLKLERPLLADEGRTHGIHARGIALERGLHLRRRPLPFGFRRRTQAQCQEPFVDRHRLPPHHFRQPTHRDAAVQLHLPQPLAPVQHAGRKPRIVRLPRIDRRHGVVVEEHFYRSRQTRQGELAVQ